MTVYVVWSDPDPGYSAPRLHGVFSTREGAEARLAELKEYDAGVLEFSVDNPHDMELRTT